MANLERRVAQLEGARAQADLRDMTDHELEDYIRALEPGSPRLIPAVLAKIDRHGSSIPIVTIDPDYAEK